MRVNLAEAINNMATVPPLDATRSDIAGYAMSYNAYERWYGDLGTISRMLDALDQAFRRTGNVPVEAVVDALRA